MNLHVTTLAQEKLHPIIQEQSSFLLLWYDIEGCGCGVNGIPTLRFIKEKKNTHKVVECGSVDVLVEKQQAVFFADRMTLDWKNGSFRLSSPGEILNPVIPLRSLQVLSSN